MNRYLPLGIFAVIAVFLGIGLFLDPREVPSPLINKPAPAFSLPQLHQPAQMFSRDDMKGKVWLLNVWASWCVACREEHPVLVEFARTATVPIVGLNYKDERKDGLRWLSQFGDPYRLSVYDYDGRIGIDYGVYGVPETFVIDQRGIVQHKHIGPITDKSVNETIMPLVRRLKGAS